MNTNKYISFLPLQKIYRFTKQTKYKKYIRYFKNLDDAIVARDNYLKDGTQTPLGRIRQTNKDMGKPSSDYKPITDRAKTKKIEFVIDNNNKDEVWEYHYETGGVIPNEVLKLKRVRKTRTPIS